MTVLALNPFLDQFVYNAMSSRFFEISRNHIDINHLSFQECNFVSQPSHHAYNLVISCSNC